jgi:hypothetical protein
MSGNDCLREMSEFVDKCLRRPGVINPRLRAALLRVVDVQAGTQPVRKCLLWDHGPA